MPARPSQPKYFYLRQWLTGDGYGKGFEPRPVILECIRSRSGMSMQVYDRGERIFTVNGCGFDRIGSALGRFLEELFQPELSELARTCRPQDSDIPDHARRWTYTKDFYGLSWNLDFKVSLQGASGVESMIEIAKAIGLKVHLSESKAGTLIVIEKGKV